MASAVDGNRIDHGTAGITLEIRHTVAFHDNKAAVAIRASGDLMRDD